MFPTESPGKPRTRAPSVARGGVPEGGDALAGDAELARDLIHGHALVVQRTRFGARGRDAPGTRELGGWGLRIVDQLAAEWGVQGSKTHVWAKLPLC